LVCTISIKKSKLLAFKRASLACSKVSSSTLAFEGSEKSKYLIESKKFLKVLISFAIKEK
jgi:hypothetical protein